MTNPVKVALRAIDRHRTYERIPCTDGYKDCNNLVRRPKPGQLTICPTCTGRIRDAANATGRLHPQDR